MKPRRTTPACLLAIACALGTATVGAAPPTKPKPRPIAPEAREDYEVARGLFARGDYKGCVEALERAQKASPDPRLFWNSAACEKKLGHYAKAMRYVERYLVASGSSLSDEERSEAAQFLEASRAYVARVTITANVEGVQVLIDDELVGTVPLEKPIVVDEGERRVRYERSGYASIERKERSVAGAELRWAVELVPAHGDAAAPSTSRPVGEVPPARKSSRVFPLLLGGAGVITAGVGAGLVVTTLDEADTIADECGTACPRSRWEKYRDQQIVGDVLIGVGAALVIGAVVWWLVTPSHEGTPSAAASRWVTPRIGGVAF